MSVISAIETEYLGYKFRSRAEARWAVLFHTGGIRFTYEPEGIKDGEILYLPDFYLPDFNMYVEVKPERPGFRDELKKPLQCVVDNKIQRLMILQDIPAETKCELWWYPFLYFHNGSEEAVAARCVIAPSIDKLIIRTDLYPGYKNEKGFCGLGCANSDYIDYSPTHDKNMYGEEEMRWGEVLDHDDRRLLHKAYGAARKARFEHGEKPRV